jgi:hypothetical protein
MANIAKQVLDKLGVIPKLRLAEKLPTGGVKSTGPHRVKIGPSKLINGVNPDNGQPRQEIEYTVEEGGVTKLWFVPILNKQGRPNYLVERIADIKEGEEIILESKRSGAKNYTSITRLNGSTDVEDDDEHEPPVEEEEPIDLDAEIRKQDAKAVENTVTDQDAPPF